MKKLISDNLILTLCKLINNFKKKKCFFFEAGANDGMMQSNTLIVEKKLNWSGILVEPLPHLFSKLKTNRPNCELYNFALVSKNFINEEIEMNYGFSNNDLMSHINIYQKSFLKFSRYKTIKVPVTTIDNLLKNSKIQEIDFLSLDVEGYEINALEGMRFKKYRPLAILVEVWVDKIFQIIDFFLEKKYYLCNNFSRFNYLNNPNWTGKHQDFLFLRDDFVEYYKKNI